MGAFAQKVADLGLEAGPLTSAPSEPGAVAPAQPIDWKARLAKQQARMGTVIPSSKDEAMMKAIAILNQLKEQSFTAGLVARQQAQQSRGVQELLADSTPGIPGREVIVDLPAMKAGGLLSPVTQPIGDLMDETLLEARQALEEKKQQLTRTTANPGTLPWFYPAAAMTVPNSFVQGYRSADKELAAKMHAELDAKVEAAKAVFEQALQEEYQGRKTASAGEIIDGLAHIFVKSADGELNQALGLYLALAGLMGQGAYIVGKDWVEKRDPRAQQLNAMRDAIKQRLRNSPPAIQVASDPISAADLRPASLPKSSVQYEPPMIETPEQELAEA